MVKTKEVQNGDIKKNVIVLRSVFGKVGQIITTTPCNDAYGRRPSCVRPIDSNGDMILTVDDKQTHKILIPENRVFKLQDGTTFNLDDPHQAAEWEAIKNCPLIAPSRDARDSKGNYLIDGTPNGERRNPRYGIAELYIEMPGKEAERKVTRKKLIINAQNLIITDARGYDGWILMAKVLGRNMSDAPSADVEDFLLSVAEKDPQKIISLYTKGDLNLRLLLIDAKEKGVIRKQHGLYVYGEDGNVILGASEDVVIEWMKQARNQRTLQLIRQDTHPEAYVEDK